MRYMLFLHNSSYLPKDSLWLKNKARALSSSNTITIRDVRVSSSHIEYDISIPDNCKIIDVANLFREIGIYSSSYPIIEKKRTKLVAISEARKFFNGEKFWVAHEVFESVWKETLGTEKEIIGGIILLCAAFVHYQKDEKEICISILGRSIKKLESAKGIYHNMDLEYLKYQILHIINGGKIEPFKI